MSSPVSELAVWPAAVNAALLGTDRTQVALPLGGGSLGAACARLAGDETDPPAALLRVAAAASAYRRCGWAPARMVGPLPDSCPPDLRPMCSPAAAGLLRRMLEGEHASLVGAWLALAARHSVRAPADTLPELLELGKRERSVRSVIAATAGTRGTWLAAQNSEWSFAVRGESADELAAIWETGAGAARVAALQQLRPLDAARARALLETSWTQESPAERVGFVLALAHGLSAADEPFLERALDDRRKEVRLAAAGLLARLPTSALVARMVERATALVTLGKSSLLKRPRINVTLPEAAEPALVRDGVSVKPPSGAGIGERAWWLAQIIGAVPPSTWTSAWSLDPDALLRATEGHEWRDALVAGWLTATERHRDRAWAEALWQRADVTDIATTWSAPAPAQVFTTVAPTERIDAELRRSIGAARDALRGTHPTLIALLEWRHEWSDALARSVARRLAEYASADVPLTLDLRVLLERCAHATPVSAIDAFTNGWRESGETWPTWAPAVDALGSVLRFRQELHLAFKE